MHSPQVLEPSDLQASLVTKPVPGFATQARRRLRWWFDIDDGGGAITLLVSVIVVFGTLVVHLVELDHRLDRQPMSCNVIDSTTLQVKCQFE